MNINMDATLTHIFNRICRLALPVMNLDHAYVSDMIYDAQGIHDLKPDAEVYVVIRDVGTHLCVTVQDVHAIRDRVRVLRVLRTKYMADIQIADELLPSS